MIFFEDYSKLKNGFFSLIRQNADFYKLDDIYPIWGMGNTFKQDSKAKLWNTYRIKRINITERFVSANITCTKEELIKKLDVRYGKEFDDFVVLQFKKVV